FSSRRRHTRFSRDWSSDVCSSDLDEAEERAVLLPLLLGDRVAALELDVGVRAGGGEIEDPRRAAEDRDLRLQRFDARVRVVDERSEERRVGKEWRSRAPEYAKQAR